MANKNNNKSFLNVAWPGKNTKQAPKKTTFTSRANVMGIAQKNSKVFTYDSGRPGQFANMQKIIQGGNDAG